MPDLDLLAKAFAITFVIAMGVGPITLLVINRTLSQGRVVGLVSGLGVATADATYGGIAAFGLTAVRDLLVSERRVFAIVGGLILVRVAWGVLRSRATVAADAPAARSRSDLAGSYASILGLTLTNPLTIVLFAALFTGANVHGSTFTESAVITVVVFLSSTTWWIVLTTGLSLLRGRVTPRWLRIANLVSGSLIGLLGLVAVGTAVIR